MKLRNVIIWTFSLVSFLLVVLTGVQAQELTEVNASDILEKIENGEDIFLENVWITGDLNVSKIELKTVDLNYELRVVESQIIIKDSVFENDVDFSNAQLKKSVNFADTSVKGTIDFRGSHLSGDADFRSAIFTGDANFRHAIFTGDANFGFANFTGDANFQHAKFNGDTDFWSAIFTGDADFGYAIFTGDADFRFANFNGDANFGFANFNGDANFQLAEFTGDTDFGYAIFTGDADFRDVNFNVYVEFSGVDFKKIFIRWESLEHHLVCDGLVYIKLIKNFRDLEQFEDADNAYYQYRKQSQAKKRISLSKFADAFIWFTCGYGVKPLRTIFIAGFMILLFSFIYWKGEGIIRLKENNKETNQTVSFWDALYFSAVTFTTVGYGDWYPKDLFRKFVVIEGLLGWLTLALFLVTLANVMIRP